VWILAAGSILTFELISLGLARPLSAQEVTTIALDLGAFITPPILLPAGLLALWGPGVKTATGQVTLAIAAGLVGLVLGTILASYVAFNE
jgi:hypothetical protein